DFGLLPDAGRMDGVGEVAAQHCGDALAVEKGAHHERLDLIAAAMRLDPGVRRADVAGALRKRNDLRATWHGPHASTGPRACREASSHARRRQASLREETDVDSKALPTRDDNLPAAYSAELEKHSLAPLWAALHVLLPNERTTRAVPHHWRWADLREPLLEAARLVGIEQAERRVLVLCNPGLPGAYAATSTLYAGLQIIRPGESAPSHHHTPAALRLVVEGHGAFTTVDGVKCAMEPG